MEEGAEAALGPAERDSSWSRLGQKQPGMQTESVIKGKTGRRPPGLLFARVAPVTSSAVVCTLKSSAAFCEIPPNFCQVALKCGELAWLWTLLKIIIIVGQGVAQTKKKGLTFEDSPG